MTADASPVPFAPAAGQRATWHAPAGPSLIGLWARRVGVPVAVVRVEGPRALVRPAGERARWVRTKYLSAPLAAGRPGPFRSVMPNQPKPPPWSGGATFSDCGSYRYKLWRERPGAPAGDRWLVFAMLNPSLAGATKTDPTVTKCVGFAERLGFDRFVVVNMFALVTPYPKKLYAEMRAGADVVGPDNVKYWCDVLDEAEAYGGRVVAAWGANKTGDRSALFARLAERRGLALGAIALTPKGGAPQHPLMAKYVTDLVPYRVPA